MKKIVRLTESDLINLVKRVIVEQQSELTAPLTQYDYPVINELGFEKQLSGTWVKKQNMTIVLKTNSGVTKELKLLNDDKSIFNELPLKGSFKISKGHGARNVPYYKLDFYK